MKIIVAAYRRQAEQWRSAQHLSPEDVRIVTWPQDAEHVQAMDVSAEDIVVLDTAQHHADVMAFVESRIRLPR